MKIDKRNFRHWLVLLRQGVYTLLAICARHLQPRRKKPIVILYGHQLYGNLKALYTEWQNGFLNEFDCYFLSLDPHYSRRLRAEGIHVLHCGSMRDMLLVGRCSAMITDHGLHAMRPFLSLTDILFIDVWHGIPFKGFIPADFRVQQRYDETWVSSPLLKEIYQHRFGFNPEKIVNLGYARTDKLFRRQIPDPLIKQKISVSTSQKIVLFAPTWQQDHTGRELFPFGVSQEEFINSLGELCKNNSAVLVIRSHLNAKLAGRTHDNVRYCSMSEFPDTESLLLHTDILICDWSSIAFDFLALDRPTLFLDVEPPFRNGFSLGREYRFGKVVANMPELCEALNQTLESTEWYLSAQHQRHQEVISAVYGENTDGSAARRQLSRLTGMIKRLRQ